jgi:hypothetical protein
MLIQSPVEGVEDIENQQLSSAKSEQVRKDRPGATNKQLSHLATTSNEADLCRPQ